MYSLRKMREESREKAEEAERERLRDKHEFDSIQNVYQEKSSGEHNGHFYVDLGLPSGTLWATCNVGAERADETGSYYQWGHTTTEICKKHHTPIGKIPTLQTPRLDMQRDAARANWGGLWRMPTKEEFEELIKSCKWEQAKCGTRVGYRVTGPDGNDLFLPRTGRISYKRPDFFESGYYWASQQCESDGVSLYAYFLKLDGLYSDEHIKIDTANKIFNFAVRPVVNL